MGIPAGPGYRATSSDLSRDLKAWTADRSSRKEIRCTPSSWSVSFVKAARPTEAALAHQASGHCSSWHCEGSGATSQALTVRSAERSGGMLRPVGKAGCSCLATTTGSRLLVGLAMLVACEPVVVPQPTAVTQQAADTSAARTRVRRRSIGLHGGYSPFRHGCSCCADDRDSRQVSGPVLADFTVLLACVRGRWDRCWLRRGRRKPSRRCRDGSCGPARWVGWASPARACAGLRR